MTALRELIPTHSITVLPPSSTEDAIESRFDIDIRNVIGRQLSASLVGTGSLTANATIFPDATARGSYMIGGVNVRDALSAPLGALLEAGELAASIISSGSATLVSTLGESTSSNLAHFRLPPFIATHSTETAVLEIIKAFASSPLDSFDAYSKRNWDGYGAEPIGSETINATRRLIQLLPSSLSDPHIAPGADGTIGLYWNTPAYQLSVDVGPATTWRAYWHLLHDDTFHTIERRSIDDSAANVLQSLSNFLNA